MTTDLDEVVTEIVHTGHTWRGHLPSDLRDTSNRRRIDGAAFSLLVMIDGDSGIGPVHLSPKDGPDVDLGGEALHELFRGDPALLDNDQQRQFMDRVQRLADLHHNATGSIEVVMGRFLTDIVTRLSQHYRLRLVATDWDTGEYLSRGDDVAPHLPTAFTAAWNASAPTEDG